MRNFLMAVDVLGVPYQIFESDELTTPALRDFDGFCDTSAKVIEISNFKISEGGATRLTDMKVYRDQVIRHELIHAFLYESGLAANSWGDNEEAVDWFAIQSPRLKAAFEQIGSDGGCLA